MSQWTQEDVDRLNAKRGASMPAHVAAKPSKYRNVKTMVGSDKFDSKREAEYWLTLKAREQRGEIAGILRQVPYDLCCPQIGQGTSAVVARYIADFTFIDRATGLIVVVDVKGHRTREYLMKKKWLELQQGIVIEEV